MSSRPRLRAGSQAPVRVLAAQASPPPDTNRCVDLPTSAGCTATLSGQIVSELSAVQGAIQGPFACP